MAQLWYYYYELSNNANSCLSLVSLIPGFIHSRVDIFEVTRGFAAARRRFTTENSTKQEIQNKTQRQVATAAQRLFRLIDYKSQKELSLDTVWDAIISRSDVKEHISEHQVLHPLRRKEYLIIAWKEVDLDNDPCIR